MIGLDCRTGSGPGGNSPQTKWWSLRERCFEKHNEHSSQGKDTRSGGAAAPLLVVIAVMMRSLMANAEVKEKHDNL